MDRETLRSLSALTKSTALVNYQGSLSINITRCNSEDGGVTLTSRVLLHGRDGIDYARANGVVPCDWYSNDRPQRSYNFREDGVEIVALELAPEGSKLINGELVLPNFSKPTP